MCVSYSLFLFFDFIFLKKINCEKFLQVLLLDSWTGEVPVL